MTGTGCSESIWAGLAYAEDVSWNERRGRAPAKYNLKDVIRKSLFARRQRPSVGRQNEITRPSPRGDLGTRHKGSFAEDTAQQSELKGPKPLIVSRLTSIKRYLMNKTFATCHQPRSFRVLRKKRHAKWTNEFVYPTWIVVKKFSRVFHVFAAELRIIATNLLVSK